MLWHEDIPVVEKSGSQVTLIAGEWEGKKAPHPAPDSWAADPENEVAIWTIKMQPDGRLKLPAVSSDAHRTLFFYKVRSIHIGDRSVSQGNLIELQPDTEIEIINGDKESHFLFLQGRPINEPVIQHGPFVANYEAEIREAYLEFQQNQFGGWPWPRQDMVNEREKGRFAQYADGKIEERA
jgi:hypothetical protein